MAHNSNGYPNGIVKKQGGMVIWYNIPSMLNPSLMWDKWVIEDQIVIHMLPKPHLDFFYLSAKFDIPQERSQHANEISSSISYDYGKRLATAGCHFKGASVAALYILKEYGLGNCTLDYAKQLYPVLIMEIKGELVLPYEEQELTNKLEYYILSGNEHKTITSKIGELIPKKKLTMNNLVNQPSSDDSDISSRIKPDNVYNSSHWLLKGANDKIVVVTNGDDFVNDQFTLLSKDVVQHHNLPEEFKLYESNHVSEEINNTVIDHQCSGDDIGSGFGSGSDDNSDIGSGLDEYFIEEQINNNTNTNTTTYSNSTAPTPQEKHIASIMSSMKELENTTTYSSSSSSSTPVNQEVTTPLTPQEKHIISLMANLNIKY